MLTKRLLILVCSANMGTLCEGGKCTEKYRGKNLKEQILLLLCLITKQLRLHDLSETEARDLLEIIEYREVAAPTMFCSQFDMKACNEGHDVKFFTAASLANILLERNNNGSINGFMKNLKKTEMIVIDELGFVPLHKDAAQLLFQVVSECYERKNLIITSNLEFSGWNSVLGDIVPQHQKRT